VNEDENDVEREERDVCGVRDEREEVKDVRK
jgi:hypothetical protein